MNPAVRNIYVFALFNAFSFQIVLGSPMVLYAKSLNAPATILGLIAGMTPLMVVFQIPAAHYVDRIGYKRFVLSGWTARTFFVALISLIPLATGWLPTISQLALLLGLLFGFNLIRGISGCGWLPWISEVIPAEIRGRYLTLDATTVNIASFLVFWLSAVVLGDSVSPAPWRFSLLIVFSALCASVSLRYLSRIPAETKVDTTKLPPRPKLSDMLRSPGFARVLCFNVCWSLASGGFVTFIVAYLKGMADWPEQRILMMMSLLFLGGISNQLILPNVLDKHGSKPVLLTAAGLWIAVATGWLLTVGNLWTAAPAGIAVLIVGVGLASSMMNLANVRLVMLTVPAHGRTHFFATYSVIANVVLGCAPVIWGMLLDTWGENQFEFLGLVWNRYAALFSALILMFVATGIAAMFLIEPGAISFRQLMSEAISNWRVRYYLRSFFRVPPKG